MILGRPQLVDTRDSGPWIGVITVDGSSWGRLINGFLENCLPIPHARDEAWKIMVSYVLETTNKYIYKYE